MQTLKQTIPLAILGLITIGILPVLSQAERMPPRGPVPFYMMDRNSDGFISEEEFNLTRGERLAQRSAEGRLMRNAGNAPAFSSFDSNTDGKLSQEEFNAGHQARMQQRQQRRMGHPPVMDRQHKALEYSDIDLNSSGSISVAEFKRARNLMMNKRAHQGSSLSNLPDFADIDANDNGVIDPGEFRSHQLQH